MSPAPNLRYLFQIDVLQGKRRSDDSRDRLIADFQTFEQPEHQAPRDKHYLRALKVTESLFKPKRTLHPIAFPDLRYYPWTKNVSAEAPYTHKARYARELRQMQADLLISDSSPTFHNLEDTIFRDNRTFIHQIKMDILIFGTKMVPPSTTSGTHCTPERMLWTKTTTTRFVPFSESQSYY